MLLASGFKLSHSLGAHAPANALESPTYGFAGQLPKPPDGGTKALAAAEVTFTFPANALRARQLGTFSLDVIASTKGQVAWVSAYDTTQDGIEPGMAATIAAVRPLPRPKPAFLHKQLVQFSLSPPSLPA